MKKNIILLFIALLAAPVWVAGKEKAPNPGIHSGYGDGRYLLSFQTEYDYNRIYGSYGSFNVQAFCPINPHFELDARLQAQTANIYTVAAVARPTFDVPVGQLYMETEVLYKAVARAAQQDFCAAISLGYRMDYFRAQVGYFIRVMSEMPVDHHDDSETIAEVGNLLYSFSLACRPQTSCWNLSFTVSNMDMYNLERSWSPLLMLSGQYDINDHWRVTLDAQYKSAGVFHQQVAGFGAYARAGFAYKF